MLIASCGWRAGPRSRTSLALLAHTVATARYVELAMNERVVGYYAAFWLPAAALGLVAGVLALRRARLSG